MTGTRVGALVVKSRAPNVNGNARWHCECDCGETWIVEGIRLRSVLKEIETGERQTEFSCPSCRKTRLGMLERKAKK